jgi:hypothetical protein
MRRIAVGAMVGAAALLAAAPAEARERYLSANLSTTGTVSVTWHGDPARGCAAAGLCGYRGSTSADFVDGELFLIVDRQGVEDAFGDLEQDTPSVVRVQRREASGAADTCVDATSSGAADVTLRGPRSGAARIGLAGTGLAAGHCAGPDLSDALLRLPQRPISLARLRRGATTIDLTASKPFRSGRFSGRLVSTLRLHVGRMQRSHDIASDSPGAGHRGRRLVRLADLHSVYRIASLAGKSAATFRGLDAPACSGVDACGVSGAADWSILSSGGTVVIDAEAIARRSDRGLHGLISAVRRRGSRGYVAAFAEVHHQSGTTSARIERTGGASCSDSRPVAPPYLDTPTSRTGARFVLGSPSVTPAGSDLLRTGCPGPTGASVLGRHPVASGRLPLKAVARRRITLRLRSGGPFDDGAYRGAWRSSFTLQLERVKERLTYRYTRVTR